MSFSDWHENENLIQRLKQMIRSGHLFHGCLFEGSPQDTERLADDFVKAALCQRGDGDSCGTCIACRKFEAGNSEDVTVIGTEGTVKDKDIELLISAAMKKSYTGRPMFMIIRNAERMTLRAQNRLLKTLEEPPSGVKIILLAENAELLAQTVRSRCMSFRLESGGQKTEASFSEEDRRRSVGFAVHILYGKPFYSMNEDISYFTASREAAKQFAETAEIFFRDVFISFYDKNDRLIINKEEKKIIEKCAGSFTAEQMIDAADCAEAALRDLSFGVSPGHALKYMIFDIQGKIKER